MDTPLLTAYQAVPGPTNLPVPAYPVGLGTPLCLFAGPFASYSLIVLSASIVLGSIGSIILANFIQELARTSSIPGIGPVLERLENADESEIQGSSQPSEIVQEREVSEQFNAAEAIQEPSVLHQTLELVKSFRRSYTEERTGLQEASTQPSNSSLVEGRNQRRDVSPATSIAQEPDQSCPPEGCRRSFNPAAFRPSSEDFDLPKSPETSSISLVQEATTISILTDDRRPGEPHIPRSALEGMARSAVTQYNADADVVIKQRLEHQPSRQAEADSTSISASYEKFSRSKPPPPFLGLTSSPSPANSMHNKIVLPPITSFSPTRDALQSSALPSLTPQTHLLRTSITSNTLGQYATNGNPQTPVRELTVSEAGTRKHVCTGPFWRPSPFLQERITSLLVNGIDDTEIPTPAGVIYRRDLRTLVPHVGNLSDIIINEYLKYLAQYTNARRESDIPDSCNKIAMIGSMDPIPPGLLKKT